MNRNQITFNKLYTLGNVMNLAYIDKTKDFYINVKTKKNIAGFENDITNDLPILPCFIFDDMLVEIIYPYDIIDKTEKKNDGETINSLTNLSIEDNPVIRICKLKK